MTRRKSAPQAPPTKKRSKVPKQFSCPICAQERSVDCKIKREQNIGILTCRSCSVRYESTANDLTDPIDLFAEWFDKLQQEAEQVEATHAAETIEKDEQDDVNNDKEEQDDMDEDKEEQEDQNFEESDSDGEELPDFSAKTNAPKRLDKEPKENDMSEDSEDDAFMFANSQAPHRKVRFTELSENEDDEEEDDDALDVPDSQAPANFGKMKRSYSEIEDDELNIADSQVKRTRNDLFDTDEED